MNGPVKDDIPDQDAILVGLRQALAAVLPQKERESFDVEEVVADTPLLSLPVDSATLMALAAETEERFRVYIPEQELYAFTTAGEFAAYIHQRLQAKAARARG